MLTYTGSRGYNPNLRVNPLPCVVIAASGEALTGLRLVVFLMVYAEISFSSDTLGSNLKLCSYPKVILEIFILGDVGPKAFRGYLAPLFLCL